MNIGIKRIGVLGSGEEDTFRQFGRKEKNMESETQILNDLEYSKKIEKLKNENCTL